MTHKTYTDQHTPYQYFADVTFDGVNRRSKHEMKKLTPYGCKCLSIADSRMSAIERIKIVGGALAKAHINS